MTEPNSTVVHGPDDAYTEVKPLGGTVFRDLFWMDSSDATRSAVASLADRYRVLLDIGRTVTGTLGLDELYRTIYHQTARVLQADGFYVSLYDAERDLATIVFFVDRGVEQHVEVTYKGSDSVVIRTGESIRVDDELKGQSLMLLGDEEKEVTRSAISAPLSWKDSVIGSISAQSYSAEAFTDDDLQLLRAIGDLAAVAIENALHVAELERRTDEANRIEEIGRALAASLDPREVLGKVIDAVLSIIEADGSTVWLLDGETARVNASGGPIAMDIGLEWNLRGQLYDFLVARRSGFTIGDLAGSPLVPDALRDVLQAGSGVAVPLVVAGEVAGFLSAGSKQENHFSPRDVAVLERLASQASVALENARLHATLQSLSLTDPLTGLPNRRHMQIHLEREVAAARRGRELVLVILDLDNFKLYNDSAGHLAGDDALRAFAQILSDENRAMNLVSRYGGDEFISILSESRLDGAQLYLARVRARMQNDPILSPNGITVTCGLACFDPDSMRSGSDLIQAADDHLYSFKGARSRASS